MVRAIAVQTLIDRRNLKENSLAFSLLHAARTVFRASSCKLMRGTTSLFSNSGMTVKLTSSHAGAAPSACAAPAHPLCSVLSSAATVEEKQSQSVQSFNSNSSNV
jgi:hypothetical protein